MKVWKDLSWWPVSRPGAAWSSPNNSAPDAVVDVPEPALTAPNRGRLFDYWLCFSHQTRRLLQGRLLYSMMTLPGRLTMILWRTRGPSCQSTLHPLRMPVRLLRFQEDATFHVLWVAAGESAADVLVCCGQRRSSM